MISFCDNKYFPWKDDGYDLYGVSTTSMDVDPPSLEGEAQLKAYMKLQQVTNDTDPLMWWKQHQQEFPDSWTDSTWTLTGFLT
jgi:hypothetical protein